MNITGKARAEIGQWRRKNLPEINVRGGAYLNNSMCHQNAVHFAWKHNEDKIAMVMTVDKSDDWAVLHFININNEGEYVDNTLGNSTTAFYNSLRIFGEVEQNGIADSVETNDRDVVISRKNFDNFKIISGLVPPYYFRRIAQTVRGRSVTVDGIEYINFELTDKPDDYRAFPLDITFQKLCFIDNKKCNF